MIAEQSLSGCQHRLGNAEHRLAMPGAKTYPFEPSDVGAAIEERKKRRLRIQRRCHALPRYSAPPHCQQSSKLRGLSSPQRRQRTTPGSGSAVSWALTISRARG